MIKEIIEHHDVTSGSCQYKKTNGKWVIVKSKEGNSNIFSALKTTFLPVGYPASVRPGKFPTSVSNVVIID